MQRRIERLNAEIEIYKKQGWDISNYKCLEGYIKTPEGDCLNCEFLLIGCPICTPDKILEDPEDYSCTGHDELLERRIEEARKLEDLLGKKESLQMGINIFKEE
ncbi:MAG: hypothetical protein Q7S56_01545 [Nanoarchaeota archaeon]|nr:hypothetical protein [Nanoarchaeota archaeon]